MGQDGGEERISAVGLVKEAWGGPGGRARKAADMSALGHGAVQWAESRGRVGGESGG